MVKGWGKTDMQETLDQFEQDMAGGADFFRFKDGDNEVRICPPAEGETKPFAKRAQHWRVGEAEKIFNCPQALDADAPCFVHDKAAELKKSDDDADVAKGEDLYAKNQFLYRIIDPNSTRKGVQVMAVGIKAHKQIAKLMRDKEYGDITDPVEGINIVIEKSGSGQFGTEYTVRPRRNPSNVVAILEESEPPDIFALCEPATNKQMKAAWNNEVTAEGPKPEPEKARRREVDDDEPKPARRAARDDDDEPKTARSTRQEDEPKPARRAARDDDEPTPKRSRAADDDEAPPRAAARRLSSRSRDED